MEFPKENGLCITCADKDECPIAEMLPKWRDIKAEHGEQVIELRPDLWDEYSIEEPDIDEEDDGVMWCPMYHEEISITYAAYIRNDGVTTKGKSHADIIKICPYGTCKTGSISGFIDSNGKFVDRFEAYKIALAVGQLQPEKMEPKNRIYLLSEDIWSNVSNGDYDYDEEQGYVLK